MPIAASRVFATDYDDLAAVKTLAQQISAGCPFTQYVYRATGRRNYNVTMQIERVAAGRCYAIYQHGICDFDLPDNDPRPAA